MTLAATIANWFGTDPTMPVQYGTPDPTLNGTIRRLEAQLGYQSWRLAVYDQYYEGEQPLSFMIPVLVEKYGKRVTALILNWPRLVADAYEQRLDVEGFRYDGTDSSDADLREVWQFNNLDEQSQQGHLDSIILARSVVVVGSSESSDEPPLVTVESPFQMTYSRDPRTRRVRDALKRWQEDDGSQWGVCYQLGVTSTVTLEKDKWRVVAQDKHGLERIPVVPLVNRPRILRPDGLSEFHDVLPLADAANKMATDMMVSGEHYIMPRRWIFGLKKEDFKNEDGSDISTFDLMSGAIWSSENENAKAGQFPEAELRNFHETIKLLAQAAAQLAALPPHYMSFAGDNPASADAIRSSETQLVKRVERKQTYLGGAWEDVMRLVLRFQTGKFDPAARSLETQWRDPSTPTEAQKADAVVKKVQAKIIPIEQAREDLGYSPTQRERMAEMDRSAARLGLDVIRDSFSDPEPLVPADDAGV
jgi:hypothetical protein